MPFESARELARRIREGETSAVEVVDAHLEHIERYNPRINAVVLLDADGARARAKEADEALARGESWGPLHGVPFTAKDTFDSAGLKTSTIAMRMGVHVPEGDAVLVARLKGAGAILLGKTNLPAASYDWQTNSRMFGCCNNPYDINRTVGGSSGGAAAALAAGMTPIELGSDVAGSIRNPAGFCGVAGLRPTEKVLSEEGHGAIPGKPNTLHNLVAVGPMARDAADLELLFDILVGDDPNELLPTDDRALSKMSFAWSDSIGPVMPAKVILDAIDGLQRDLAKAGAEVVPDGPAMDWMAIQETWGTIQGHEFGNSMPAPIRWAGFRWLLRTGVVGFHFGVSQFSKTLARGFTSSEAEYRAALDRRGELIDQFATWVGEYDAWLCPVTPMTAFRHRRTGTPIRIDGRIESYSGSLCLYGCPIAVFACPVVVIRIGQDDDGLPIGIQIVGRPGADRQVLRIARMIEELRGGFVAPELDA